MTPRVNLLPAAMVRRRRRSQRIRLWSAACVFAVVVEAGAALFVGSRAREVRRLEERIAALNGSLKSERAEVETQRAALEVAVREVRLAQRLREKHYWSRWLGALSRIAPDGIALTVVQTEPARAGSPRSGPAVPAKTTGATDERVRKVRVGGLAAGHDDFLALMTRMHGLHVFRSVQLNDARRETAAGREGVRFDLTCEW